MKDYLKKIIKDLFSVEMLLYILFGTGTAVIDIGLYSVCYDNLPIKSVMLTSVSNLIAWVAATLFAFITNKLFVFRHRHNGKKKSMYEMIKFFSARLFSLAFSMIMLIVLVDMMNKNAFTSKILATVVIVILNYIASKLLIFNDDNV